jgi:hypothetical protein
MFKSFLCIVCERFLPKLTFVEAHDKKENKLFSLASCTNWIYFISKCDLKIELKSLKTFYVEFHFEFYIKVKPVETKILYLLDTF